MERQSAPGWLGIRRRIGLARNGFLGDGTVKPTIPLKPGLAKSSAAGVASRPPTAEERRRAQRVLLRMTVVVHLEGKPQPVQGITHTVSENGGMGDALDRLRLSLQVNDD